MSQKNSTQKEETTKPASIFTMLVPYRTEVFWLVILAVVANGLSLFLPKLIANGIDAFGAGTLDMGRISLVFGALSVGIFVFTFLQSIMQTYVSEKVARDLRREMVAKISRQSYRFILERNPSTLLTNMTSDIDSIKMFVSMAIVSLVTSAVIIVGASIILLSIDWKLALCVLTIIPLIGGTFFTIFRMVRVLFKQSREVIDWLNKVINESIMGAGLIRVLHSDRAEYEKFASANTEARRVGLGILKLFSFMIPIVTFVSNLGTLMVVVLGGHFVITNAMTIGSFAAFNSYIMILIFPILILGFISNIIAQAGASYVRIASVLSAEDEADEGKESTPLSGRIDLQDVTVLYGEKPALKSVSLTIAPHTKTAIIGPTAAGKTQLFSVMTGLTLPTSGIISYDGKPLADYLKSAFYPQVGMVFQDSVLFNTSVRENIAFSTSVTDESLQKAIDTAELADFLGTLPEGLDTVVSERGTSLSGGQKQRLMLARALALDPTMLFLDDFTARVDTQTERKILANITKNYPGMTIVSITQKIAPIETYDQIILLMEGEVLARGTHEELMHTSPEYVQIFDSQRSTNTYELRT